MRLTHVLHRCASVLRAAARRVGQTMGLLGRTVTASARAVTTTARTVTTAVARVVQPALAGVRAQLGGLARVAVPVAAVACSRPDAAPPSPPVESQVAFAPTATSTAPATSAIATTSLASLASSITAARATSSTPAATTSASLAPRASAVDGTTDAAPTEEKPIGDFLMTFYYIAVEDELAPASPPPAPSPAFGSSTMADIAPGAMPANDNASASAASASAEPRAIQAAEATAATDATDGPTRVPMLGRDCQPLAEVTPEFAASVRMQGTGRLRDGRLINVAGACSCGVQCFHILPPAIKWGTGSSGLPLSPFRMVAVDPTVIKMGSLLYIPELDGMRMPGRAPTGGFIHDGCVVAADVGGRIKGNQLDFFVARRAYYDGLARRGTAHGWATHVEVWDGSARCTRRGSRVSRSAAGSI